ncbi:MAG: isochorismatase family protein [Dehalococcoidia bacterium]|nr:isochorismatase family protein [Dehalococcoidia bacterium]
MTGRVWDRFLTEQDKAHLAASGDGKRRVGFGTRPALLLVDLYRWVFGDEPQPLLEAIKTWPNSCGLAAWQALPYIQRLLSTAREVGIPVIHITYLDTDGLHGWYAAVHRDSQVSANLDPEARDRFRRRHDIVDEVAPLPGELVLRKCSPSAFWGTPLVGELKYLDVDTLIVAGESTSGCVRASVTDGCTNRFRMIVVEECVFDRHEAPHAMSLFDMHQKYADVIPLDEAIAYLQRWHVEQAQNPRVPK